MNWIIRKKIAFPLFVLMFINNDSVAENVNKYKYTVSEGVLPISFPTIVKKRNFPKFNENISSGDQQLNYAFGIFHENIENGSVGFSNIKKSEWKIEILPPINYFGNDNYNNLLNMLNRSHVNTWLFQKEGKSFLEKHGSLVSTLDLSSFTISIDEINALLSNLKEIKSLVLPFTGVYNLEKIELPHNIERLTVYNTRISNLSLKRIANIASLDEVVFWGCCVDVLTKKNLDDQLLFNGNNTIPTLKTPRNFNAKFENQYNFNKMIMLSCSDYFIKCMALADYPNLRILHFNTRSVFPILSNSIYHSEFNGFNKLQSIRMYAERNPHKKSNDSIDNEIKFYKDLFELSFKNYTDNILHIELVFTN